MIDFGLASSMLCCWVWLIVPRIGEAKLFEADEIVRISYENSRNFVHVFCSCIMERLLHWHHARTLSSSLYQIADSKSIQ